MAKKIKKVRKNKLPALAKTPTGIEGLDEITEGGFPKGRPTLICGSAGCGKTLMGMQFLIEGIREYDEPGVFMSFEESSDDLTKNVSSLGFDVKKLVEDKKLLIDQVQLNRSELTETGEYDLEGLFIRLGHAIDTVGAKRVVLDTIESLFSGLDNEGILRLELRRLFHWLKKKGVTSIITAEKGEATLTREGLEEYISDCVVLLDFRVIDQISTRRLRIVKYRGSTHGTNEYPFLIDEKGVSVLPITSLRLEHGVSQKIVSTGIPGLDSMFKMKGYYEGSSVLISGTAGTAKTTLACYFAQEICRKKGKVLYFAFEESPNQLIRNMESVGLDLRSAVKKGLLQIHATRPVLYGLEMHLLSLSKMIKQFKPTAVIIDPISNLVNVGTISEVSSMLVRLIDLLKVNNITALFTSLNQQRAHTTNALTEESVSSLVDTWITVRDVESAGERNRGLFILKSRGMGHSNQVREFLITDHGVKLLDMEVGPDGLLTGAARSQNQLLQTVQTAKKQKDNARRDRDIVRKKKILETNIKAMRAEFESAADELKKLEQEEVELNAQMHPELNGTSKTHAKKK